MQTFEFWKQMLSLKCMNVINFLFKNKYFIQKLTFYYEIYTENNAHSLLIYHAVNTDVVPTPLRQNRNDN